MKDYFIPNVRRGSNRYDGHALVADMYQTVRPLWRYHSNGLLIRAQTPPQGDYTFIEKDLNYPTTGQTVEFELTCNASFQRTKWHADTQTHSHSTVHLHPHKTTEIEHWLYQRAHMKGFSVIHLETEAEMELVKRKGAIWDMNTTHFTGAISILDETVFKQTLHHGIGRSKAFGYGLLTITPLN